MAENDTSKVGIGAAGKIYIAPAGTKLPSDATTTLPSAFENFGYVSDSGIKIAESSSQQTLASWGGGTVKTLNTSYSEAVTFTPIEINAVVMKAAYGDDQVTVDEVTGAIKVIHKNALMPEKVVVIDTLESETIKRRYVVPKAQLTARGDISLTGTGFSGRELTFTGNQDSDGNSMYDYMAEITKAAQGD